MPDKEQIKVLAIDDDKIFLDAVKAILELEGYEVLTASQGSEGIGTLRDNEDIAVVLLDLNLPGGYSDAEVLQVMKRYREDVPVVIVSADGDMDTVLRLAEAGADDFIVKQMGADDLIAAVGKMVDLPGDYAEVGWTGVSYDPEKGDVLQGRSPVMTVLIKEIYRIAQLDSNVLITGETGTGKELIARTVHEHSDRRNRPFCIVDCSGLPHYEMLYGELWGYERGAFSGASSKREGRIRQADGGTVFLDEIGVLNLDFQVQLLRFCQTKDIWPLGSKELYKADVRIIAATNVDLKEAIEDGRFRSDLYHRLSQSLIEVPPLRERQRTEKTSAKLHTSHELPIFDDVESLVDYAIDRYNKTRGAAGGVEGIELTALELLRNYQWPGNLRQLNNVVNEAASRASARKPKRVILKRDIENSALFGITSPPKSKCIVNLKKLRRDMNANRISQEDFVSKIEFVLDKSDGDISKASELGGVTRKTMHEYINKYIKKTRKQKGTEHGQ